MTKQKIITMGLKKMGLKNCAIDLNNQLVRHLTLRLRGKIKTAGNSTFAIGGVSCSAESFVVAESAVLRINICAKKPAHRKSANRYGQG